MQRDAAITELLNEVLTAELTSVNQYFVDYKMLENWGYEPLAKHYREESIDEMKDADALIGRILFLEGVPNLQRLGTVRVGETRAREAPARARPRVRVDRAAQPRHRQVPRSSATTAPASCSSTSSRARKSHADWLETQLGLVATARRDELPRAADPRLTPAAVQSASARTSSAASRAGPRACRPRRRS